MNPANRAEMVKLLESRFKLEPKVSGPSYDGLMTPGFGLSADARFNMDGFRNVLAMRAEMEGQWGGVAPAPDKYIDLSYYGRALGRDKK